MTSLLSRLPAAGSSGARDVEITEIAIDSRRLADGALFVAMRGNKTDGHRHVAEAVANGAAAVVVEEPPLPAPSPEVPIVYVPDSKRALSTLSSAFYGDPSRALDVVGVTGTNGKTTATRMVAAILDAAGKACGLIGTVGAELGSQRWALENTTPLPPVLHALLAQMRDAGAKAVAMEVSSHALALERVDDVRFRVAALTNVTRDHLDFHGTHEAYAAAKRRLFDLAHDCVLNVDDAIGARWAADLNRQGHRVIGYGIGHGATLVPSGIVAEPDGMRFSAAGQLYAVRLPGRFNVWNALAAIAIARLMGVDDATSARGLAALDRIPGRMERLHARGIEVVVDYAHTPDALESALHSLRETARGALAIVFGCGGDRDRGKRPEMGEVASRLADRLYLTSDNPRTEEPQEIVNAIAAGIGAREYCVDLDRRRAIERAIGDAHPGDVVLIAGKGHETYQIVGERVLPFDDAAVAREALSWPGTLR